MTLPAQKALKPFIGKIGSNLRNAVFEDDREKRWNSKKLLIAQLFVVQRAKMR
jgi:hypothetical protein